MSSKRALRPLLVGSGRRNPTPPQEIRREESVDDKSDRQGRVKQGKDKTSSTGQKFVGAARLRSVDLVSLLWIGALTSRITSPRTIFLEL